MSPGLTRALQVVSLVAVFFVLLVLVAWPHRAQFRNGDNDFAVFYTGARLLGTGDLYEPYPFFRAQQTLTGGAAENRQFSRLPYVAFLFRPFTWLPYRPAHWLWQSISLVLLAAATAVWTRQVGLGALGLTCLSFPVMIGFLWARDESVVLLAIALAVRFLLREQPVRAGMAASLGLTMWHVFLPVVLLVGIRRLWRLGAGLLAGSAVLAGVSFLCEGWDWPLRYVLLLRMPVIVPGLPQPNLHGALGRWPWVEAAASLLLLLLLWVIFRRGVIEQAVAAALISGLLLSFHAYPSYSQILLPAAFLLLAGPASAATRVLAVGSAAPPLYLFGTAVPQLVPLTASALLVAVALDTRRRSHSRRLQHQ